MNIWLIGMMGSGKTTVGQLLAQERGADFHDVDAIISTRVAGTISELWQQSGEDGFRAIETSVIEELSVIRELSADTEAVIASGGGAVLQAGNRQAMRGSGTVVWLRASADVLAARLVGATDRPLLADGVHAPLSELLETRLAAYQEAAHHVVDTTDVTPAQVVEQIAAVV